MLSAVARSGFHCLCGWHHKAYRSCWREPSVSLVQWNDDDTTQNQIDGIKRNVLYLINRKSVPFNIPLCCVRMPTIFSPSLCHAFQIITTLWAVTGLRDYNFRLNGFLIDIALTRRAPDCPCIVWRILCWRTRWGRGPPRTSVCSSGRLSSCDRGIGWRSCYCLWNNCWWWYRLCCRSAGPSTAHHNISGAGVDGSRPAIKGSRLTMTSSAWVCARLAEWPWLATRLLLPFVSVFRTPSRPVHTDSLI